MTWSLSDVIENRPALSRWHPECMPYRHMAGADHGFTDKARFDDFIASTMGLAARSRSRGRPSERDQ